MEIQEFRNEVKNWPSNARGRLLLTDPKRSLIRSAYKASGLTVGDFCEVTGLKQVTVSKITKSSKKGTGKKKPPKEKLFQQVKFTEPPVDSSWSVYGPQGLQVKCQSLLQLTQLWRSLC
jgi:hypothetical protein